MCVCIDCGSLLTCTFSLDVGELKCAAVYWGREGVGWGKRSWDSSVWFFRVILTWWMWNQPILSLLLFVRVCVCPQFRGAIQLLLQHGGDVWLRNAAGKTAAEEVHTRSEVRMCTHTYIGSRHYTTAQVARSDSVAFPAHFMRRALLVSWCLSTVCSTLQS